MQDIILLVIGAYGTGNVGDEAILSGLTNLLTVRKNYDRNRLVVLSRDPGETRLLHNL